MTNSQFKIPGLAYPEDYKNENRPWLTLRDKRETDAEGMLLSFNPGANSEVTRVPPVGLDASKPSNEDPEDCPDPPPLQDEVNGEADSHVASSSIKPQIDSVVDTIDKVDETKVDPDRMVPENGAHYSDKSAAIEHAPPTDRSPELMDQQPSPTLENDRQPSSPLGSETPAQKPSESIGQKGLEDDKTGGLALPRPKEETHPLEGSVPANDEIAHPDKQPSEKDESVVPDTMVGSHLSSSGPPDQDTDPKSVDLGIVPPAPPLPKTTDLDAEFAYDSSPYSSSTDSSDNSSEDDSDDTAEDYELLGLDEQARLLMAEDGAGSEDEGGGGTGRVPAAPKTINEKPEVVVPKPEITISPETQIVLLGHVETVVENHSVIKAVTSGEYQVLETGSLLCLEDKTVVGVVAETLGRVQQPFYSVAFTNAAGTAEVGMDKIGAKVFYVPQHAYTVFTEAIKGIKGSDASNLHDEEIGDEEIEFSDDEKEAEYKRMVKQKREAKKQGRDGVAPMPFTNGHTNGKRGRRGNDRRGRGRQDTNGHHQRHTPYESPHTNGVTELRYEDNDDGLYTPLQRPETLHGVPRLAPPPTQSYAPSGYSRPPRGGRGNGFSTGGRGRGARGGAMGNHSLPPRPPTAAHGSSPTVKNSNFTPQINPPQHPYQQHQHQQSPQSYQNGFTTDNTYRYPANFPSLAQTMQQQQQHYQQYQPWQQQQSPMQPPQQAQQFPAMPSDIPPGAFINPAFFRGAHPPPGG